ncbi:hypothetical protein IWW37_004582 [Coemansia sp. RSA 2050]|nr:hypothetical protein IWW37_004582 [Coemansia sp. RSA 2050]KAJ2731218.1 hypothetical protein IW152_004704 [Coemansia sp. BCRC 34962]
MCGEPYEKILFNSPTKLVCLTKNFYFKQTKTFRGNFGERYNRVTDIIRDCTSILVPLVIRYGDDYVVTERVSGITFKSHNIEILKYLYREFNKIDINTLRDIGMNNCWIRDANGFYEDFKSYVTDRCKNLVKARGNQLPPDFGSVLERLGEKMNHESRFNHGDLQPQNIMLNDKGRIVLVDLEFASVYPKYTVQLLMETVFSGFPEISRIPEEVRMIEEMFYLFGINEIEKAKSLANSIYTQNEESSQICH